MYRMTFLATLCRLQGQIFSTAAKSLRKALQHESLQTEHKKRYLFVASVIHTFEYKIRI